MNLSKSVLMLCSGLLLTACGGGGGGGSSETKAVSKAYLFCAMSSSSTIASVTSSLTVPSGITVSHATTPAVSSPTTYEISSGVIQTSATPAGSIDTATGKVTYNLVFTPQQAVLGTTTAPGTEIATLNFQLTTAGVRATLPTVDAAPTVGKTRNGNSDYLNGCTINYVTTYQ